MFRVGDIITGNEKSNNIYIYTNENGTYKVTEVDNYGNIVIEIIEHIYKHVIGEYFEVKSKYFKPLRREQTKNYIGEDDEI